MFINEIKSQAWPDCLFDIVWSWSLPLDWVVKRTCSFQVSCWQLVGLMVLWSEGGGLGDVGEAGHQQRAGHSSLVAWVADIGKARTQQEWSRLASLQVVNNWVSSYQLQLPHLLLPDLVIAVRYQILPHFCQGKSNPGVSLGWGSEGCDLYVEIFLEMLILGILRGSQLLLLNSKYWTPCSHR